MRHWPLLKVALIALLIGILSAFAWRYGRSIVRRATDQTVLRLAVSRADVTDMSILRAFALELSERRSRPGLEVIETENTRDAARALVQGRVHLAVVRPDIETPNGASAVLRLRTSPLILVARKEKQISTLADLEGQVVGLDVRDRGVLVEVNTVFAQSQRLPATEKPVTGDEIESSLLSGAIDVALFTPTLLKGQAGPALVRHLSGQEAFRVSAVQPDDVSAVIASLSAIAAAESGLPKALRGEEEDEVVCANYLVMARNDLSSSTIAQFTERLFYMRAAITKRAGRQAAFSSPAGENLTSNAIPLHKGAIEYYEREQKTFFERNSDALWIGIALSGMFSSVLAWFARRVMRRRRIHINNVLGDLDGFARGVRTVPDAEALKVYEQAYDALIVRIVDMARNDDLSEGDLAAVTFAREHAAETLAAAQRTLLIEEPRTG